MRDSSRLEGDVFVVFRRFVTLKARWRLMMMGLYDECNAILGRLGIAKPNGGAL